MSSMNENLLDKIARADFSMVLQFQRLSDMELNMVSAAGDMDFLRQQEQKKKNDKNQ